ncbi:portal protein [Magnetospirillum sp. UT-4]|uniref:portal protein n=1 Tax=Magnetospirillum sp. UT-4 TaxID=2681467 RepID=UPI00137EB87E|nr:portal protein [Magnetospirillum sp. UT-4]CAA7621164.1 putative Head-TO-tail joining protein [Magnetospirillum sp. UT-4]
MSAAKPGSSAAFGRSGGSAAGAARDPVLRRYDKAKGRRDAFNALLQDGYDLALPGADPTGTRPEGAKSDVQLYEGQGMRSVTTRRARMHNQLFPPFDDAIVEFELEGLDADDIEDDALFEKVQEHLAKQARKAQRAVTNSNFHLEIPLALGDSLVSTGALMVNQGPSLLRPLVCEAVPIAQLVPEEGTFGILETVFRPRSVPFRDIEILWDDAAIPAELAEKHKDDPDANVAVLECQIHDPRKETYQYLVYVAEGERRIVERTYTSPPIIAFRMGKFTGEVLGRGPVLWCRADLKTANAVKKMHLQHLSIAAAGIWQADDDGVINVSNIRLVPGTIIPKAVGSQGLQPLQSPARFDVSQMHLEELRRGIKETIEGPPLPGYDQDRPVAYAFQAAERNRAEVEVPQHLRLYFELDMRFWRRVIDILSNPAMAGSPYAIELFELDGRMVRPIPKNPLVRLQENQKALQAMQALLEVLQIAPNAAQQLADTPKFLRRYLLMRGFPADCLVTADKLRELQQQAERERAAMMAGAQQGFSAAAQIGGTPEGQAVVQTAAKAMGGANG